MKGDQAKSLVPITVRITADVKPKPNVAEIQVSHNEQVVLPFNTYGNQPIFIFSTVPVPPVKFFANIIETDNLENFLYTLYGDRWPIIGR